MQSLAARIKNEWKAIGLAVWMIAVSGYLLYLNSAVQDIRQMTSKLSSDVDSVESILISTDNNVAEMKKRIDEMSAKVDILHKRIRRR
jgi:peptidoglycan hydrolase CwlO-like protein